MLKVRNFEKFQHYKDRSPIWIKLYRSLLRDYEFGRLPDASRAHLMLIWLLASETGNELPNDAAWIGRQINASDPVDLDLLIRSGFLIDCDSESASKSASKSDSALPQTVLAQSRAEAEQRQRAETESEAEQSRSRAEAEAIACPPAAAAANDLESHLSAFARTEIEDFVRETKPHIKNVGGFARTIWRSGVEDEAIGRWKAARDEPLERHYPKWVYDPKEPGSVEEKKRFHDQLCENQRRIEAEFQQEAASDAA